MILIEENELYEGLVTNFWVLKRGDSGLYLETAPWDKVLQGTVSEAIVHVASLLGIPVYFQLPKVEESAEWIGCFLCNSLRWIQPISQIDLENGRDSKDLIRWSEIASFTDFTEIQSLQIELMKYLQS
jgi:branched-subunit amino acid aminotransferase/4-amino-4-deoxychorismate lyase